MKIKVGDKVKILTGADKNKVGTVLVTLKDKNRVVVEGVNIVKKHQKPSRTNETGGILETEASIHASNVKVISDSKKSTSEKASKKEEKKPVKKSTKKEKVGEENV